MASNTLGRQPVVFGCGGLNLNFLSGWIAKGMFNASMVVGKRFAFMEPSLVWISVVGVGVEVVAEIRAVTVKRKRTCIEMFNASRVVGRRFAFMEPSLVFMLVSLSLWCYLYCSKVSKSQQQNKQKSQNCYQVLRNIPQGTCMYELK